MNISKSSWHYKLLAKNNHVIPTSLCSYFWDVVIEVAMSIWAGLTILFMISVLVGVCLAGGEIISGMLGWFNGYSLTDTSSYAFIPLISTFSLGALLIVILHLFPVFVYWITTKFKSWGMVKKHKKEKTGKESGLLLSYLKAKKQKVCPVITFTEEEK